jgi:hypothetical protein
MATIYRYPLTKLESRDDYLKISFLDYIPPGFSQSGFAAPSSDDTYGTGGAKDIVIPSATAILPIPDDIRTSNTAQWGPSSLNPFQAGVADLIQEGVTDLPKLISSLQSKLGTGFQAGTTGTVQKFIQAATIAGASNVLLSGVGGGISLGDAFSRYAGSIFNSNIELIFTSVSLREPFTFSFDIVPRSKKESDMVKSMIVAFKKHSAAKKNSTDVAAQGLFLKAPGVFKLEYMNGSQSHPYLNRFKICACQGVAVNYTGSGTYATYDDATPVHMQLTLSFQELTPIYAEDYDTPIGSEATGF